jgi:tripartite-type tricarboxylate transporter receptor subunit TctC
MWRKALVLILVTFSAGGILIQPALGKEYPTNPIEIVVPYPPGAPMDLISRLVADTAPKFLGQSVVVVNKTGAGGSIAAADVIGSKPDGYKIFNTTSIFFAMTTKTQKIPFDPGHLTPLVNVSQGKIGLCVKGDSPWKTFNDLLDYAKKNPGKLRWAHSGRGTADHVPMLLIFRKAGAETIDVPTKGTPEKVVALLGGHVDASFMAWGAVTDHVKAGKIRYLMMLSDQRYSDPSDVPCPAELGYPEVAKIALYNGYYVHKDTPNEVKKILFDAFKKTYEDPEFQKGFEKVGDEPRFEGPEFLKDAIRRTEELSVPILKELGLYVGK